MPHSALPPRSSYIYIQIIPGILAGRLLPKRLYNVVCLVFEAERRETNPGTKQLVLSTNHHV